MLLRRLANPPADALKSEGAVAASYPPAVRRSRSAAAKRTAERYRRAADIYEASRLHGGREPWDVPRHRAKDRPGSALPPGPLLESELRRGERATRPVATSVVFSVMDAGRLDDLAKPPGRPGSSSHHHRSAWVRRQIAGTPGAATYDTYAKRLAAGWTDGSVRGSPVWRPRLASKAVVARRDSTPSRPGSATRTRAEG